jgi:hypothetical protein
VIIPTIFQPPAQRNLLVLGVTRRNSTELTLLVSGKSPYFVEIQNVTKIMQVRTPVAQLYIPFVRQYKKPGCVSLGLTIKYNTGLPHHFGKDLNINLNSYT